MASHQYLQRQLLQDDHVLLLDVDCFASRCCFNLCGKVPVDGGILKESIIQSSSSFSVDPLHYQWPSSRPNDLR